MIKYDIIATGSSGNAVIIEDNILIDCGVPFSRLKEYVRRLKLILLTHQHFDHFNKATIKRLAFERPTLRFACAGWLVQSLVDCGVKLSNIDVLQGGKRYSFGICEVEPFELPHSVPNVGYKLYVCGKKLIYATDTSSLDGVEARDFDLYMIEANHTEQEITDRIAEKLRNGEYSYEFNARVNHLSREQADEFIYSNIGAKGVYIYMHSHEGLEL